MDTGTIAVVAFHGISPFHLSVPCAVFSEDRRTAGVPLSRVLVCAQERGPIATSAGFSLARLSGLREMEKAGIVIVPSWRDPAQKPPEPLLDALRQARARGAIVVGLCLGSYVLAAAGLLDGRSATTHWAWADDLAERYPRVRVNRDVLYVDEGEIVTSAGGAAGIDCCLHIMRELYGAEVASRVARRLVVPPHRQGGQAQYIEQPIRESAAIDQFTWVLEWVQQNLDRQHTLDSLAERVFMSRRTFTRRFRQATGTTVGNWLLNQRLAQAQRLLESSGKAIALIAQETGFGSEVSLRQHFTKVLKTSPGRYRKEFRGG